MNKLIYDRNGRFVSIALAVVIHHTSKPTKERKNAYFFYRAKKFIKTFFEFQLFLSNPNEFYQILTNFSENWPSSIEIPGILPNQLN